MSYPYFDNFSIVIFLFVGTVCMLSVKIAKGDYKYNSIPSFNGLFFLFSILVLFATIRKVGFALGGSDALGYQSRFLDYYNHGAERYESTDILFGYYIGALRFFTDNPYIYRFISYGIIAWGYVAFIKKFCPQYASSIPFICIVYPYLRSFNTMRNSISIALFLFSVIALYDRKTIKCIIFFLCSVMIHRLSFIMVAFFPFYFLFRNFITNANKKQITIFVCVFILLSYLLAVQLQKFIIVFSFLQDNGNADFWYLTHGEGKNILNNWPMYLVHVMLLIALLLRYKNMPKTRQVNFIKIIFIFDIIMLPATLILGMWRFAEYFYVSNLILWGVIISVICKKLSYHSAIICKCFIAIGFYTLLYIRIEREWEPACLLPYLFFWQ